MSRTEKTNRGNDPVGRTEKNNRGNDPVSRTEKSNRENDPVSRTEKSNRENDPVSRTEKNNRENDPVSRTEKNNRGNDPVSRTEKNNRKNDPVSRKEKVGKSFFGEKAHNTKVRDAAATRRRDSSLPAALLVCAFLFVWQAAAMKMSAAYILPSPIRVVVRLWELRGPLFGAHLPATMQVVAIGLVISIFLGLGLAILMDFSPVAQHALYPLIIASQTIPTTALAPLFVLWFGYSIWSRVLVTVLFTFFPVVVTVYDGFRSIPAEMKELMDTYGATPAQIFLKLKIPAVLPYFFSALKMAVPLSVIGAAIGEWLGAQSGLGYFSRRMMTQLDGAGVFAPILLLSIAAELLVVAVGLLERHFLYWRGTD